MFLDQLSMETIMAGRNGSVGGEDEFPRNAWSSPFEADTLLFHAAANRFQHGERAVALIQMKDSGA